jgi:hypothetical protein
MNWLLQRVLAISLILAVMFAAALLVARLNRTPDSLQALGFDVCDGEPCFRGIKLGTDWQEARNRFPEAQEGKYFMDAALNNGASVSLSSYNGKVNLIMVSYGRNGLPALNAGEVILRYGWPCRLLIIP